MLLNRYLLSAVILFPIFVLTMCSCGPTPPPPPPPPFVTITNVSNGTPTINENVSIRWEYSNAANVERQVIQLLSLTLDGSIFTETQGCLPSDMLQPGEQPQPCLGLQERAVSFPFRGPVMVRLIARDNSGVNHQKMIKLRLPGESFTVDADFAHAGYPRFGAAQSSIRQMQFERAFGIFENTNNPCGEEDGRINALLANPLNTLFATGNPFFMSSNNAAETAGFNAARGSNFPFLDPGFRLTPEGSQLGNRNNADALIFAGTLAVDGTIETVKGDNGADVEVITITQGNIEPFFVVIDIRSTDGPECRPGNPPQRLLIADVHIGNAVQGLVLSSFRGHIGGTQTTGVSTFGFAAPNPPQPGMPFTSSGSIKGAVTGFGVTTSSGEIFTPDEVSVSAEWTNIPIFPDTDLGSLRGTYIRFSP